MSVFLWLVIVWGAGLAGVIAAGFASAIVNAGMTARIQGTPLEAQSHTARRLPLWDMLGYRTLDMEHAAIASEHALPAGLAEDLRMLRRLELALLCALTPCAAVLLGCWLVAAR